MTPLLQQARGALTLAMPHHQGFHSNVGAAIAEALTALDAYEALSDYDKAIEALAPYLEDGWYAQEYDGSIWWHFNKPEVVNRMSFERPKDEWLAEGQTELVEHIKFPRKDEWRDARFQIKAGRVVPQGEGGRDG